jgi:glutamyl-tRNA reductase
MDDGVVSEAVLISTCNRTEVYAVVEDESARSRILKTLADDRDVDATSLQEDTYWLTDAEAVRHLYRVASSLDSMVVGEGQILGQVRDAYRAATEERSAGPILNRLFHTSLRIGKDVRSQTGIGDSSLSIPHVAAKLAGEVFGTLEDKKALVLGAGGMSELVIEHLKDRGVTDLRIANRTPDRAVKLAEAVGGQAVAFKDIPEELEEVDVVVSSTGSADWVIGKDVVSQAMSRRSVPLFCGSHRTDRRRCLSLRHG